MKRILLAALIASLMGCSQGPDNQAATDTTADAADATTVDAASSNMPERPTQGVSDDQILLGGFSDLSGVFAAFGVPAQQAAQMYFEEVNAAGGVHGRNIRYIVEDHGYQVPKAVQAANKLISNDKVFASFLSLGTPHNSAAFPIMDRAGVPSILPLSLAKQMSEKNEYNNRYVLSKSYYESMTDALGYLVAQQSDQPVNLCVMYIASDFGEETLQAAKDMAESNPNVNLLQQTSHRPDESDFSGALAKLREADCNLVTLALSVRATIGAAATIKSMGWDDATFIMPLPGFHSVIAGAPGGVTENFYAVSHWDDLNARMDNPDVAEWSQKFKANTGEDPSSGAIMGYAAARAVVAALEKAGPDLTQDSFLAALDQVKFDEPVLGSTIDFTSGNHTALDKTHLSQVQNGMWQPVTVID